MNNNGYQIINEFLGWDIFKPKPDRSEYRKIYKRLKDNCIEPHQPRSNQIIYNSDGSISTSTIHGETNPIDSALYNVCYYNAKYQASLAALQAAKKISLKQKNEKEIRYWKHRVKHWQQWVPYWKECLEDEKERLNFLKKRRKEITGV